MTSCLNRISENLPIKTSELSGLKELNEESSSSKTHKIGPQIIQATDLVSGSSSSLPEITVLSSKTGDKITPAINGFSANNVAWEALKAGLAREELGNAKLKQRSDVVKQHLNNIDDLLDLNAELTSLGDKDSHELSDKTKGMISKLRGNGIEVWSSPEKKISKEKLVELKSHISSQVDKFRTSLQTIITTEIQPEINCLNSIMNIIQQMIQSDARMKKHAIDKSAR